MNKTAAAHVVISQVLPAHAGVIPGTATGFGADISITRTCGGDPEDEYTKNRMLDKRFIPKMEKMLGTGINVYLKVVPKKNLLGFGIEDKYIFIEW